MSPCSSFRSSASVSGQSFFGPILAVDLPAYTILDETYHNNARFKITDSQGFEVEPLAVSYQEKVPVIIVGGETGCFLGEYQAGGLIVVLGLNTSGKAPVDAFCATGMHGGSIFLRSDVLPDDLPDQVVAHRAEKADLEVIRPHVHDFCAAFGLDENAVMDHPFYCLKPNTNNPYKQLYTQN